MNTLLLKYALEVEKTASISKAAQNLFMNQPHLSKAIRELEGQIGIILFDRSSKGMFPTPLGTVFLEKARAVLQSVEEMEALGHTGRKNRFSLCVYTSQLLCLKEAFVRFVKNTDIKSEIDLKFRQYNNMVLLKLLAEEKESLGIICYEKRDSVYFNRFIRENSLCSDTLGMKKQQLLISEKHPLAKKEAITNQDLQPYVQLPNALHFNPPKHQMQDIAGALLDTENAELQRKLLKTVPVLFQFSPDTVSESALPDGLICKPCTQECEYIFCAVYAEHHMLTQYDIQFIELVRESVFPK